jgi:putative transposase
MTYSSSILYDTTSATKRTGHVSAIRFYSASATPARWIGVDLNTTGHVAVAADPESRIVIKLGKNTNYIPRQSSSKCVKLYRDGKLWKLRKIKTRERRSFKVALHTIAKQIVSFAESRCAGIKFEKLFSNRSPHSCGGGRLVEFSFENGSFISLQNIVEKRANDRGIHVLYVNPANTSKRCSRCGGFGRRLRKRFECPCCGSIMHADANAAFNIASTSHYLLAPCADTPCHSLKKH